LAKDWVTLGTSAAALLISLATAYFNFFHLVDDVSVGIARVHHAAIDRSTGKLRISGTTDLTFINSGNRPAAVSWVSFIASPDDPARRTCWLENDSARYFSFQSSPFVVAPGQIIVKTYDRADYEESRGWEPMEGGTYLSATEDNAFTDGQTAALCLSITVTTPDAQGESILVPVYKYTLRMAREPSEPPQAIPIDPMHPIGKPFPLVNRYHVRFLSALLGS
jgi:hypothetical protein